MLLTLDNLAHRYHCLPSEALSRATTLDLHVLDVSAKWTNYQYEKSDPKSKKTAPKLTQEEMLAMVNQVKERA